MSSSRANNHERRIADVRSSVAARLVGVLRLYDPYRALMAELGYESPFVCVIKSTWRCQLCCTHCNMPKTPQPDMTTAVIQERMDAAHRHSAKELSG